MFSKKWNLLFLKSDNYLKFTFVRSIDIKKIEVLRVLKRQLFMQIFFFFPPGTRYHVAGIRYTQVSQVPESRQRPSWQIEATPLLKHTCWSWSSWTFKNVHTIHLKHWLCLKNRLVQTKEDKVTFLRFLLSLALHLVIIEEESASH